MASTSRPRRLAIADDSAAFVAAVAAYFECLPGYQLVGIASAPSQAPELVESARPDLLLLDLGLPAVRGLELVRQLKAAPGAPAVFAMTLFHTPEAAAEARRAGAEALIGKEAFVSGLTLALARLYPAEAA